MLAWDYDPAHRMTSPRLLAGAFGGAAGGVGFAILMMLQLMRGAAQGYAPDGMAGMIAQLLRTDNPLALWGVHLLAAAVFGAFFAMLVAPTRARRTVPAALGFAVALWLVAAFLGLRLLTGTPLAFSFAAFMDLAGHLVFGLVLGVVYVAFFRAEDDAAHERATTLRREARLRRA